MSAPVITGTPTSAYSASSGTLSLSPVSGIANGDILIIVLVTGNADSGSSDPSGWSQWASGTYFNIANTGTRRQVWWKRTSGSESSVSIAVPTGGGLAVMFAVRGALGSGDPFDGSGGAATNVSSGSMPAITTSTNDCLVIGIQANGTSRALSASPLFSNNTMSGNADLVNQNNGVYYIQGTVGTLAASGSSGTWGFSISGTGYWASVKMSIKAYVPQQFNQDLTTGAVNTSEAMTKAAGKPFSVGLTLASTMTRAMIWARTLIPTVVSTLETLIKSRALALIAASGKTPTPTLTKANVWARTVSAAVGKSASYVRAVGKRFTLTQFTQFPTGIGKGWGKSLTATQATVSSLVKGAAQLVTMARTIGFNATVSRGVARTILVPGATFGAIAKAVTARISAIAFAGASTVRGLAMAITAAATTASVLGRALVRVLSSAVNASADFVLQISKVFALALTLVPRLLRALTQRLVSGVAATPAFVLAKGLILTAVRATTTTLGKSFIKAATLAAAMAQPVVLIRSITARLSAAATTAVTLLRQISARLTAAAQGTSATILRMRGKLLTATATTAGAIVKRINMAWATTVAVLESIAAGRPLLMVASAVTSAASLARTYARTLTAAVGRTATQLLSRSKLLLAASTSTASRVLQAQRAMVTSTATLAADALAVGKRLALSVTTTAAFSRALALVRTLSATVTTTATIARLLARYGLLVAAGTTTSTIRRAAGKALSAVGYGTALVAGSANRLQALSASVAKAAGMVKAVGKPWALALTSTATFRRAISWTIGFMASPAPTIRRAVGLIRSAVQPLAGQLLRAISVRLTAAVGRAASIVTRFAGRIAAKPGRYVIGIWHKRRAQR